MTAASGADQEAKTDPTIPFSSLACLAGKLYLHYHQYRKIEQRNECIRNVENDLIVV